MDTDGDLHAVRRLELVQHPGNVRLHRRDAHIEVGGDLGVGLAVADRDRDLAFPVAQPVEQPLRVIEAVTRAARRAPCRRRCG